MTVSARRRKGLAHSLTAGRHTLIGDEPEHKGGTDTGPTPSQLLALSLASCTAITIEMYADRKGWDVGALEVEVEYDLGLREGRARFEVVLKLPESITDEQLERLIAIAHRCPVHRTLMGQVEIVDRAVRVAH
jgi:putative redox protein